MSAEHKLRAVITTFERIIITAFNQKLAPGALSTDVLNQIVYHINNIAAKNAYNMFVHEPTDLYNLEVSFIHRPEEHTIILILHVPFVVAAHLLTLSEFVSLPIWTLPGANVWGSTFSCEGCTVLKTNIVNDCMGSLFLAGATLIKANCKFRILDTREKIFSLGNNTWLVNSVGTIATNHECLKPRSSSPLTISSGQALMVQPGCHILTMDYLITADESEHIEVHSTWLDWTMTVSTF